MAATDLRAVVEVLPNLRFPTKVGIQIHPERLVGFIWAPAFAGKTEVGVLEVDWPTACCRLPVATQNGTLVDRASGEAGGERVAAESERRLA
jgi:hypothetical protein